MLINFYLIFSEVQMLTKIYFKVNISFKQEKYFALHFEKNCDEFTFKALMPK